jgi:hypothetical protein
MRCGKPWNGHRVWGRDKTSSWGWCRVDEPHLRLLRLRLDKAEDSWVDVTLLRRVNWLQARVVEEGGLLYLDMAEMGTVGWARVLAVEACPALEEGPGCLVTGTFCHSHGVLYDLLISGGQKRDATLLAADVALAYGAGHATTSSQCSWRLRLTRTQPRRGPPWTLPEGWRLPSL